MPKNYALFDGNALVAERGIVVYSGAFGLAKRKAKLPYTTTAPAQILIRPICRCVAIRSLGSFCGSKVIMSPLSKVEMSP